MSGAPVDLPGWLAWQERIHPTAIDLGLERLRPVAARMGLDRAGMPLVTVAGTNGKGSTVAFLEALCLAHGQTPGCYLSPHVLVYNECVRIAGRAVSDAALVAAFARVEAARDGISLTAFEHRTLAAMDLIRRAGADVMLLEVGLGGRLDAVNLLDADVAVITAIGLDHQAFLGDSLEAIAREKAGVLRPGRPAVLSDPGSRELLEPLALEVGARVLAPGRGYDFAAGAGRWWFEGPAGRLDGLPLPALAGAHQRANAAGALAAFQVLPGAPRCEADAAARALAAARVPGRLEGLAGNAWVDVAHNPQAARSLAAHFAAAPALHAVVAMYEDKDHAGTLAEMAPRVGRWYLADLPPPRGAPAKTLAQALAAVAPGARVSTHEDVESAWRRARADADAGQALLAFGSFETARRVLRLESAGATLDT